MSTNRTTHLIEVCLLIISLGVNVVLGYYLYTLQHDVTEVVAMEQLYTKDDFDQYANDYCERLLGQILSDEEIKYLAQRQYSYILKVNDQIVTSNYISLENVSTLRISIAEVADDESSLPESLQKMGSLIYDSVDAELTDFIAIYTNEEYEITKTVEGANTKYAIEFKKIEKNSIVSLSIGDVLLNNLSQDHNIKGNYFDIYIQ